MNNKNIIKLKVAGNAEPVNILDDKVNELELSDAKVINKNLDSIDMKIGELTDTINANKKDVDELDTSINTKDKEIKELLNKESRFIRREERINSLIDGYNKRISDYEASLDDTKYDIDDFDNIFGIIGGFDVEEQIRRSDIRDKINEYKGKIETLQGKNMKNMEELNILSEAKRNEMIIKDVAKADLYKKQDELYKLQRSKQIKQVSEVAFKYGTAVVGGLGAAALANVGSFTGSQSNQNAANNVANLASKALLLKANPVIGASIIAMDTANNALNQAKELKQDLEESKRKQERLGGLYDL